MRHSHIAHTFSRAHTGKGGRNVGGGTALPPHYNECLVLHRWSNLLDGWHACVVTARPADTVGLHHGGECLNIRDIVMSLIIDIRMVMSLI